MRFIIAPIHFLFCAMLFPVNKVFEATQALKGGKEATE